MNILVPMPDGFDEVEAMTIVNVLRRAGIKVTTAGLPGTIVEGSRNVKIMTDAKFDDVDENDYDAIVLPGGSPGYTNLSKSKKVLKIIGDYKREVSLLQLYAVHPPYWRKQEYFPMSKPPATPDSRNPCPGPGTRGYCSTATS